MIGEKPCPYRIVDDIGGAYAMGAVAGSIIYFIKGNLLTSAHSFSFIDNPIEILEQTNIKIRCLWLHDTRIIYENSIYSYFLLSI